MNELKDLIEQKKVRHFDALMKVAELLPTTITHRGAARTQIMNSKATGLGRGGNGVFGRMHASAALIDSTIAAGDCRQKQRSCKFESSLAPDQF
ncbi:MAG: hypothetical protein IT342_26865 [Candidatus Melainabacteria bacterium]|nr:hypothetical protein [Candidatus Melainabacteria bacterium]